MALSRFEFVAAGSVAEACSLLAEGGPAARIMAGGTDLLVRLKVAGPAGPDAGDPAGGALVVGLRRISELERLEVEEGRGLTIGAMVRLADVAADPAVRRRYPAVAYAASETGTPQVRNMGTVVGNICNAAPSADNAPALLALGARLTVAGPAPAPGGHTSREIELADLFTGPGVTVLTPGEIVTSVFVPEPPSRSGMSYRHLSARGRVDISAVGVAAFVALDEDGCCRTARIALGGVAPTPVLVPAAQALFEGSAADELGSNVAAEAGIAAADACHPISDVRASADYRRRMVRVLTERAVIDALAQARGGLGSAFSGESTAESESTVEGKGPR